MHARAPYQLQQRTEAIKCRAFLYITLTMLCGRKTELKTVGYGFHECVINIESQ